MGDTGRPAVKEQDDLFVIRARIAGDLEQVQTENLARAARAVRRVSGPRAWLGHKMVAVGTILAGDPVPDRAPSTGRSN
jgi:hypothetical protein